MEEFFDLPERLGTKSPEQCQLERWQLSAGNPFFRYGRARHFISTKEGRVRARCSAIINPELKSLDGLVGQIGFFEAEDDGQAVNACLSTACSWLRSQGALEIWGPMQFSIWHGYRFMTHGHDLPAFAGEPRNPVYYPRLFEQYGFVPFAQWRSWDLSREELTTIVDAAERALTEEPATGFHMKAVTEGEIDEALRAIHQLCVASFSRNVGFCPIGLAEFEATFQPLKPLVGKNYLFLLLDEKEAPQGFIFTYPDARCELVLHTMALTPSTRGRGVVNQLVSAAIGSGVRRGNRRAVGALAKAGPTLYDKIGAASREYWLYQLPATEAESLGV